MRIKKVGILGGSFNPPHEGHLHIANLAVKNLDLDELWIAPAFENHLKKSSNYLSYPNRLKACENLCKNHPQIMVKKFRYKFVYNLIKFLNSKFKNHQFFWVMGDDNLNNLHRWYRFEKLSRDLKFAVFLRHNSFIKNHHYPAVILLKKFDNILIFNSPKIVISSTQIRKKFNA